MFTCLVIFNIIIFNKLITNTNIISLLYFKYIATSSD